MNTNTITIQDKRRTWRDKNRIWYVQLLTCSQECNSLWCRRILTPLNKMSPFRNTLWPNHGYVKHTITYPLSFLLPVFLSYSDSLNYVRLIWKFGDFRLGFICCHCSFWNVGLHNKQKRREREREKEFVNEAYQENINSHKLTPSLTYVAFKRPS